MPLPAHVVGGTTIASVWGNQVVDGLPQIGVMSMYAGDTAPTDYLMCRGQAVSRTTYAGLFVIVGVRFGAGDGSTTFNLPDMRGRYGIGYNLGGSYFTVGVGERYGNKDATGLPAHQHAGVNHLHGISLMSGPMDRTSTHSHWVRGVGTTSVPGGFGEGNVADIANTGFAPAFNTNDADINHLHDINGATGGADRDLTTGVTGSDVTNANLPPSLSLNFIIRAL